MRHPNKISAEVLCDSITPLGFRMISFKCVLPRIILAELNTHKMLVRNLASSRAIRFEKALTGVATDPFQPLRMQKDHPGMQGTEYFEGKELFTLENSWIEAQHNAMEQASRLHNQGLTKQLCNRLIEPFQYVTAIISATEWENFLALRASSMAEIHIADLAEKILWAANESTPRSLFPGEYHRPMGLDLEDGELSILAEKFYDSRLLADDYRWWHEILPEMKNQAACGRIARISYQTLDDKPISSVEQDIRLFLRLKEQGHWSPMEHIGRVIGPLEVHKFGRIEPYSDARFEELSRDKEFERGLAQVGTKMIEGHQVNQTITTYGWSGPLRGFEQYRKTFPHENRREPRLLKKTFQNV